MEEFYLIVSHAVWKILEEHIVQVTLYGHSAIAFTDNGIWLIKQQESPVDSTARHKMWSRLIGGDYSTRTHPSRKRARINYATKFDSKPGDFEPSEEDYNLNSSPISTPCTAQYSFTIPTLGGQACYATAAKQEKETNMACYDNDLETSQRNHLKRRVESVYGDQDRKIREKYLPEVEEPNTKDEITRKLTAGEFTLQDCYFTKSGDIRECYYYSANKAIVWTDLTKPQDKTGYDAALTSMNKAYTAAKDTILVMPLADGLRALQDFEAMEF